MSAVSTSACDDCRSHDVLTNYSRRAVLCTSSGREVLRSSVCLSVCLSALMSQQEAQLFDASRSDLSLVSDFHLTSTQTCMPHLHLDHDLDFDLHLDSDTLTFTLTLTQIP